MGKSELRNVEQTHNTAEAGRPTNKELSSGIWDFVVLDFFLFFLCRISFFFLAWKLLGRVFFLTNSFTLMHGKIIFHSPMSKTILKLI